MEVIVNNKTMTVPHNYTVSNLIKHLNYIESVAVFINGKQILMSQYGNYQLSKNDNIRIIKPLGGG
ncbi:sulfur carrier protein ThiS [Sedimentibacter hydroxybenzoicus DSM 7310]|uniref:Sulfur carrier protein ThiS n=1 Tax=Sedimentibacter hydroxybenzoicus DSM 7310 TaxID=1123245 RepID=A0A974BMZ1_SEDHY|nr:sulfur carrier protein ThiS [Sedimentibacter hydroxybenzoicus]NYB75866.1 sulfur carrier protein ThiS [Sedimentibacter hydroxybenzoicus DSM 7310]